MLMNGAEHILVIVLSIFLAIFLLLGIIVLVLTIKILKHLRNITERAESIADKAEAVSSFVGKAAGPMAIVKLVTGIVESVRSQATNRTTKRRNDDGE